jgi:dihydroneopterin aldolase
MSEEIWIELRALRVRARIGVTDAELETERPLLIDLDLIPVRSGATASDEIADTLDYSEVAAIAERVAISSPHRTLERVAARIAEALLQTGAVAEVGVRVAKPDPPMDQTVASVAVRLARTAE